MPQILSQFGDVGCQLLGRLAGQREVEEAGSSQILGCIAALADYHLQSLQMANSFKVICHAYNS
jgi:hypothetical protein